jgi:hypothetical protein
MDRPTSSKSEGAAMRRITLATAATLVMCGLIVPNAFAWGGAKITSVSCPEIHTVLPVENGPWKVLATDEAGHTLVNVNVPGSAFEQIIGGLWTLDNATHQVKVTVGNAANINDGKVTQTTQMTNCAAPVGRPGPVGPKGDPGTPGIGYDCTGTAVPTGGTPAMCPGTPGPKGDPGPPGKVLVPQTTCTSRRVYRFLVRKRYVDGHLIRSVRAKDSGAKMTVKRIASGKLNGRLQVTADYRGFKVGTFTHTRHIEVDALVATRGWLVLNENADLCRSANGHQNAPSASSDAKPTASSVDAARVSGTA